MSATLSREDTRRFYDRFGAKQDRQGYYEDPALDALIAQSAFAGAHRVLEIGCGTGKLAARLLAEHLPARARYVGIDLSATMVGLATERLKPWAGRAQVHLSGGDFDFQSPDGPYDRIVSTYVFDLLSLAEIDEALAAAHKALIKGGLLCLAGLTEGCGPLSIAASRMWSLVHSISPSVVGGCRPLVVSDLLLEHQWRTVHKEVVVSFGVPSEVLIAEAIH